MMATLFHPVGLTENCRGCATQSLQYLKDLKTKTTLQRADPASVRIIVQKILHLGQVRYTNTEYFISVRLDSAPIQNTWLPVMTKTIWFSGCSFAVCRNLAGVLVLDFFPSVCFDWCFPTCLSQELRPKGMDIRQEELGDLVDKEMAATSAAIEEAVRRIDVSASNL